MISELDTIAKAKEYLRTKIDTGAKCPCCKQFVKMYRRPMTGSMARVLVLMYHHNKKHPGDWLHVQNLLTNMREPQCPDFTKLVYWGLIEDKTQERHDGSPRNGLHRITLKGEEFVDGMITVESHVKLYNDTFYGFSGRYIGIKDIKHKNFNYEELMHGHTL